VNPPTPKSQRDAVAKWNRTNQVGTAVIVRQDDGTDLKTSTRSEAFVMGGHTAMIMVEGISGGYMLSRVRAAA